MKNVNATEAQTKLLRDLNIERMLEKVLSRVVTGVTMPELEDWARWEMDSSTPLLARRVAVRTFARLYLVKRRINYQDGYLDRYFIRSED